MKEYFWQQFSNVGFIITKFTDNELMPIRTEIEKIQKDFSLAEERNLDLAGHIKREYSLIDSQQHIENLLTPFVSAYDSHFNYIKNLEVLNKNVPIKMGRPWVNFQKKYEFNPPHNHSGVLSFVLWIKLPFNIDDEYNIFPKCRDISTSCFNFLYTNSLGKITLHKIEADRKMENHVLIFPSEMLHYVNPFYTSDEYRISVSGNFSFMVD